MRVDGAWGVVYVGLRKTSEDKAPKAIFNASIARWRFR